MAFDTLSTDDRITGGGALSDSVLALRQGATFGVGVLPAVRQQYGFGTGDNQANKWYLARRTLAPTTFDNLNLTSGLSTGGVVQAFTALKRVFVGIISPDGAKSLRVGPQNQTHANQLWFQAVTANFYDTIFTSLLHDRPFAACAFAVGAGATDVLSIYNPGGLSLDYAIWLLGTG